jgi:hypothetical protein
MPLVYRFQVYDINSDESPLSRRLATKEAIDRIGGKIVGQGIEVDERFLGGEVPGMTAKDFGAEATKKNDPDQGIGAGHIFISYASKDGSGAAQQLVVSLEAAGRTSWTMSRMKAGAPFPAQIVAAIRESCGLVLLLTPGANESKDVLQEVHLAHDEDKLIVPVVVGGTRPSDGLSYFVRVRQQITWIDANSTAVALVDALSAPAADATAPTGAPRVAQPDAEVNAEISRLRQEVRHLQTLGKMDKILLSGMEFDLRHAQRKIARLEAPSGLRIGARVRHADLGNGEIIRVEGGSGSEARVTVQFDTAGVLQMSMRQAAEDLELL